MFASANVPVDSRLQSVFLTVIVPRVRQHARVYFRDVASAEGREEAAAEAVALAWKWCLRLARRGKDFGRFPTAIATFAARAVRAGRKLCGQDRATDVLSRRAQRLHGFAVRALPGAADLGGGWFGEALADNAVTPPPDQAAFRIDFPAWRRRHRGKRRRVMDRLILGDRPGLVAKKIGLSPARVSQLRAALRADWRLFHGHAEGVAAGRPAARPEPSR